MEIYISEMNDPEEGGIVVVELLDEDVDTYYSMGKIEEKIKRGIYKTTIPHTHNRRYEFVGFIRDKWTDIKRQNVKKHVDRFRESSYEEYMDIFSKESGGIEVKGE